jgi:glutamyl-tRNA reductase
MNLLLAGISHKTSPLEVRERFAVSDKQVPAALRRLQAEPEIEEAVILSTCNRAELVFKVYEHQDGMAGLRRFLDSFLGLHYDELAHCFYVHHDYEAVRHLFRVASGLDSMVVGEPQVFGQVKQAYALSKQAKTCGSVLESVFHQVFSVAKRVRTETRVTEAAVSLNSAAALELAEQGFGSLRGKTVLIVGAGQMGDPAGPLSCARRSPRKAVPGYLLPEVRPLSHACSISAGDWL